MVTSCGCNVISQLTYLNQICNEDRGMIKYCKLFTKMKSKQGVLFLAFGISVLVTTSHGYPTGAPPAACANMMPQHGANPQTSVSPYNVTISKNIMYTSGILNVSVLSQQSNTFKGFLVRVFPAGSSFPFTAGEFYDLPSDSQAACENGVTHTNANEKENITFSWRPTNSVSGNFTFVATVVSSYSTFWTNITSHPLFVNYTAPVYTTQPSFTTTDTTAQVPSTPKCENGKGCFKVNCQQDKCDSVVIWEREGDYINFEILSTYQPGKSRWKAIGFSNNNKMADTSVVMCKYHDDYVSVELGYTDGNNYGALSKNNPGLRNMYGLVDKDMMLCRFQRLINVTDEQKIYDLRKEYFLMMGTGPIAADGTPIQHENTPIISPTKIDFLKSTDINGGVTVPFKVKLHATLMICAWILLSSIGIVIARYYKNEWPNTKPFGQKMWFIIHRALMVLVFLITSAGFAIIFVEKGQFVQVKAPPNKSYVVAHPYLGIVVMALTVINPVMSLFRCSPGHRYRHVFHYSHLIVGTCAQLASAATIFIGFNLNESNSQPESAYIMLAYIVTFVLIEFILEIHRSSTRKKAEEKANLLELSALQKETSAESNTFKLNILTLHVLCMIGYTAALLYLVIST